MEDLYLNYEQNICLARVFLNMLGLSLDDTEDIAPYLNLKIYAGDNKAGELSFYDDKVLITAECGDSHIEANYNSPKIQGFKDKEYNALFCRWKSNINFNIYNQNSFIDGNMSLDSTMDSEFGNNCICHLTLNGCINNKSIELKMKDDDKVFSLTITEGNNKERILFTPCDDWANYIFHEIENKNDNYRKCCGVCKPLKDGKTNLLAMAIQEKNDKEEVLFEQETLRVDPGSEGSKESIIQKCTLMQELDEDMYQTINEIRRMLNFDNIALFDRLISFIYNDNYDEEEMKAIFGFDCKKIIYQDTSDNLTDAYFGKQKNLLKIKTLK